MVANKIELTHAALIELLKDHKKNDSLTLVSCLSHARITDLLSHTKTMLMVALESGGYSIDIVKVLLQTQAGLLDDTGYTAF